MLDRILQGFLQHTEETHGDSRWQRFRNVLRVEIDFHRVAIGQLFAKPCRRRYEPQEFQFRRVKTVRQRLNIGSQICKLLDCRPDLLIEFSGRSRRISLHQLEIYTQHRQPLNDVVVKLSGESGALFFVRFDQFLIYRGEGLRGELALGDINA